MSNKPRNHPRTVARVNGRKAVNVERKIFARKGQ